MSTIYKVQVNKHIELDITTEDVSKLDAISTKDGSFHVLDEHQAYLATVVQSNFLKRTYKVIIHQNEYEVVIADDLDRRIKEMGFSLSSSKHVKSIKSPMPGMLLQLHVEAGQEVKEDDPLFILEAMKMENIILSPINGTVKHVSVKQGVTVDKGQLIIEFE